MRAGALVVAAALVARPAGAEPRPYLTGWYAPAGVVIGASQHPAQSNGLVLGVEQSLVHQRGPRAGWWGGLYADLLRDFGSSTTRFSAGPELGYGLIGVDGGFVTFLQGSADRGVQGRLLFSLGVLSLYGRAGWLPTGAHPSFTEVGLLIKWPISLGLPPAPGAT